MVIGVSLTVMRRLYLDVRSTDHLPPARAISTIEPPIEAISTPQCSAVVASIAARALVPSPGNIICGSAYS
jgi:hypothetical protein